MLPLAHLTISVVSHLIYFDVIIPTWLCVSSSDTSRAQIREVYCDACVQAADRALCSLSSPEKVWLMMNEGGDWVKRGCRSSRWLVSSYPRVCEMFNTCVFRPRLTSVCLKLYHLREKRITADSKCKHTHAGACINRNTHTHTHTKLPRQVYA